MMEYESCFIVDGNEIDKICNVMAQRRYRPILMTALGVKGVIILFERAKKETGGER